MREPRRSNGREVSEEVGLDHTSAQVLRLYRKLARPGDRDRIPDPDASA
jgi:hypothetical protein